MRGMNSESVDLIYLDPPFNSKANYAAPIGSEAAGAEFKDTWSLNDVDIAWLDLIEAKHPALNKVIHAAMTKSDKSYLIYMAARLLEMHRVLKPTGSIYLHCDPTMSHYLKLVMDAVFGRANFRNEVIWHYRRWTAGKYDFQRMHDIVLRYAKGDSFTFNIQFEAFSEKTVHRQMSVDGQTDLSATRDIDRGTKMNDVWLIPYLHSQAKERVGYLLSCRARHDSRFGAAARTRVPRCRARTTWRAAA